MRIESTATMVLQDGPEFEAMLKSFKAAYSQEPYYLLFTYLDDFEKEIRLSLKITMLQHESGSGNSINFEGYTPDQRFIKGYMLSSEGKFVQGILRIPKLIAV